MTPAALLQRTAADGLQITVTPERQIKVSGSQEALTRWMPEISLKKLDLIAALSEPPPDIQDFIDDLRERAAINEYDGGTSREQAEIVALRDVMQKWGMYP